jgi:hypothetical protein
MTEHPGEPTKATEQLLGDLGREYYALLDIVTGYDQRQMTIKGWSVTLSLAALLLGFQEGHYALFGLAAATAAAFWTMDVLLKRHQVRYYPRMRDIEVTAFALNRVPVEGMGEVSAPRVDLAWGYTGRPGSPDVRVEPPERRGAQEVRRLLRSPFWMAHVMLPHVLAVALGTALFVAALLDAPGLAGLAP